MLCENCNRSEATTHIKRVVNGETTEHHLCSACANELGYTDMFSGFAPLSLSDFFGDLLGDRSRKPIGAATVTRCPRCGNSFQDIVREFHRHLSGDSCAASSRLPKDLPGQLA